MAENQLKLGDEGCSIEDVVEVLHRADDDLDMIEEKISKFMLLLRTERRVKKQIRYEKSNGRLDMIEVTETILREWRSRAANEATIGYLIQVFEALQLRLMAEALQEAYPPPEDNEDGEEVEEVEEEESAKRATFVELVARLMEANDQGDEDDEEINEDDQSPEDGQTSQGANQDE